MALPTTGLISLSNLQSTLGGSNPISISEYYRAGTYLPINGSSNVPVTGSAIRLSNFYSSTITYEIIGGGGAGGDAWDDNNGSVAAQLIQKGGDSQITGALVAITATGGLGGINGFGPNVNSGLSGDASFYGAGGVGGTENAAGGNAPSTSYGAGGGGGTGDNGALFDEGGPRGEGGKASTRLTGSISSIKGTVLNIVIGLGGLPWGGGNRDGGKGAAGICKITKDGITTTFTSNGTYTV